MRLPHTAPHPHPESYAVNALHSQRPRQILGAAKHRRQAAEAMKNPIVFFDFAGPDDAVLKSFYSSVFGWEIDESGQFDVPVADPVTGAIRKDPSEKRIYLGVPDIAACLTLIEQSGGTIDAPRFEVPGVVVLGLFRDPAGNPMGLVEMDREAPRIP